MLKKFLFFSSLFVVCIGCSDDDCTRTDRIGGGLLPEQTIEVPCDFPEPEPLIETVVPDSLHIN